MGWPPRKHKRQGFFGNIGATATSHNHDDANDLLYEALGHSHTESSSTAHIFTGEYTGDGGIATHISVNTSFTFKYVRIWEKETGAQATKVWESTNIMVNNSGAGLAFSVDTGATVINTIIVIGEAGFFVDDGGIDAHPNTLGIDYEYMAIGVPL